MPSRNLCVDASRYFSICVSIPRQLDNPRSKGPSSKLDELDAALGLAADGAADAKRVRTIEPHLKVALLFILKVSLLRFPPCDE
jgi:hypothetical protein